jgi:hypothetical protein
MKPLNLDNRPCSPISSNCVVWQGPDISCIEICNGDTVSDVVAALATELCTILDQTNVSNYDLSCLGITACGPKDFQALIQLLIEKICELQGVSPSTTKDTGACPDCIVTVASCFIQNGQTTMQLLDYVQMIAEKVCALINQIADIQQQLNDLTIRVEILENTPPPVFEVPSVSFSCAVGTMVPGQPYPIDTALQIFINQVWCPMSEALGTPTELLDSYVIPCEVSSDVTTNPHWTASPSTLAESITNIWLVLCDLYDIINNISLDVQDTNSIDLTLTGGILSANIVDTGWVDLLGFDHYAAGTGRPQCRRIGNQIHFRGVVVVPLDNPASPGNVVSYTSTSYNSIASGQVYTGGGGVVTNPNGAIQFNNSTSVIPPSVINAGTNLDNTYGLGFVIGTRPIDLDSTYGTALSAVFSVGITSDKKLYIAVLKDLEITNTRGSSVNLGTSALRFITSNVRRGEYVPDYIAAASDIHNAPSNANFPLVSDTKNVTWPFDCDAGEEDQIGGFGLRIDNLVAYLDPCNTDIKEYICK